MNLQLWGEIVLGKHGRNKPERAPLVAAVWEWRWSVRKLDPALTGGAENRRYSENEVYGLPRGMVRGLEGPLPGVVNFRYTVDW